MALDSGLTPAPRSLGHPDQIDGVFSRRRGRSNGGQARELLFRTTFLTGAAEEPSGTGPGSQDWGTQNEGVVPPPLTALLPAALPTGHDRRVPTVRQPGILLFDQTRKVVPLLWPRLPAAGPSPDSNSKQPGVVVRYRNI